MDGGERDAYRAGIARGEHWPAWVNAWHALYQGRLLADDIEALARDVGIGKVSGAVVAGSPFDLRPGDDRFGPGPDDEHFYDLLGNHDEIDARLPDALKDVLDQAMRTMNGSGIWRSPKSRGVGASACDTVVAAAQSPLERWRARTLVLLREHLRPDPRSRALRHAPHEYAIPVLSPGDRRAFLRAQWSPFLPEACWQGATPRREGTAQVYLDVSGSMSAEMPLVIALLSRLSTWIRRPFWAFSDVVVPAVIEGGQLKAKTTGGTSMGCVLAHLARTRPTAAIVVTDGYVERLDPRTVQTALAATRLTALVTRDGNPAELRRAGIPYRQLDKVPT